MSALVAGTLVWPVLLPFAGGGAVAMLVARRFAGRISGPLLQRVFSAVIVLIGIAMLIASFVQPR
jgi:hypothetical protein